MKNNCYLYLFSKFYWDTWKLPLFWDVYVRNHWWRCLLVAIFYYTVANFISTVMAILYFFQLSKKIYYFKIDTGRLSVALCLVIRMWSRNESASEYIMPGFWRLCGLSLRNTNDRNCLLDQQGVEICSMLGRKFRDWRVFILLQKDVNGNKVGFWNRFVFKSCLWPYVCLRKHMAS